MPQFVHLHTHSEYSVVDATLKVKTAVSLAKQYQQPAIALTDQTNMFALVKFYSSAMGEGIKPIIGSDIWVEADDGNVFKIVCLCQNDQGYLNLSHLISMAYLKNQKLVAGDMKALVKQEWLAEFNDGLLILSGGRHGDVGQALLAEKPNLAAKRTQWWMETFPNRYYLELVRTGREQEEQYIVGAVEVAQRYELPVVATNEVCFESPDDFDAHEVRVCIHDGYVLDDKSRPKRYSEEQYFRSTDEMVELFEDLPEAIENTIEIAKRCNVTLTLGTYFLPDFPVPDGLTLDEYFIQESEKGLNERLNFLFGHLSAEDFAEKRKEYDDRLTFELDIITQMGFPGYFFIVADFIQWGKKQPSTGWPRPWFWGRDRWWRMP